MSESVKISALELENVKRVRAVELKPSADGLTVIGGRNAQGKTSVLDAIAWALGGDKLKPKAPNRDGAANPARLHVELTNGIVVERKGKNGTLQVTDSRGMRGGQQLLNAFVSQLALDLPRFMGGTDKQRADYLMGILGIDGELSRIDREIKSAYDERRFVGRDADAKAKAAESMPAYDDVPDDYIDVSALNEKMQAILIANGENAQRRKEVEWLEVEADRAWQKVGELARRIKELQAEHEASIERHAEMVANLNEHKAAIDGLRDEDVSEVEGQIRSAQVVNDMVRANIARAEAMAEAESKANERDGLTERLNELRAERVKLLDDAGMPLPGLSVEDGTLTYNGHVWSDMSGAEQLRVATAITRATRPECGFVLVDKLEQFDTEQLREFAAWAEGEGLQVIGTRVATDDSCTVVIEDGRIVGQDMQETPAPDPRGEAIAWGGDTF